MYVRPPVRRGEMGTSSARWVATEPLQACHAHRRHGGCCIGHARHAQRITRCCHPRPAGRARNLARPQPTHPRTRDLHTSIQSMKHHQHTSIHTRYLHLCPAHCRSRFLPPSSHIGPRRLVRPPLLLSPGPQMQGPRPRPPWRVVIHRRLGIDRGWACKIKSGDCLPHDATYAEYADIAFHQCRYSRYLDMEQRQSGCSFPSAALLGHLAPHALLLLLLLLLRRVQTPPRRMQGGTRRRRADDRRGGPSSLSSRARGLD